MKTKISRIGKKTLSVVIALMMIVSTMLVGMVTTNAATAESISVGADVKYYYSSYYNGTNGENNYFVPMIEDSKHPGSYIVHVKYDDTYKNQDDKGYLNASKKFKIADSNVSDDLNGSKHCVNHNINTDNNYSNYSKYLAKQPSDSTFDFYMSTDDWNDLYITNGTQSSNSQTSINEFYIQYTPGTDNHLKGTITVWTVSAYDALGTTSYRIEKGDVTHGSFTVSTTSAAENDTITVTTSPDSGYEVDTVTYTPEGGTAKTVSGSNNTYTFTMPAANVTVNVTFKQSSTSDKITVYFKNTGNWSKVYCYAWYGTNSETAGNWPGTEMNLIDSTNKVYSIELSSNSTKCVFNPGGDTGKTGDLDIQAGKIFIYDSNAANKGSWDDYGSSTPAGAFTITDKTDVNGSLSFSTDGKKPGTADAGNTVNVTVTPVDLFTCTGITVTYKKAVTSETVTIANSGSGNNYTFVVPADLTTDITKEISVKATFKLDKSAYMRSLHDAGTTNLFIDVAPNDYDTTATLIARTRRYTGSTSNDRSEYIFYLPKNVDLSNLKFYSSYDSEVKINGVSIPAYDCNTETISLSEDTSYTPTGKTTSSFRILKGSTDAMFLTTSTTLPTSINSSVNNATDASAYKAQVNYAGGSCKTLNNDSFTAAAGLSSIKGRGNSSWEASARLFGKYAFNMKLNSATSLFDLPKSKSFCLLANNADDAMMRNAYIYQLAKDIGLYDSPEFEFVDIFDNGEYMGAYLVTEKVDVASKDKLIKGNSIDKLNEDAGAIFDETNYKQGYANIKSGPDLDNDAEFVKKYQTTGTYLLEFEIDERYLDEISWFISAEGQHVVVKNPEFATKGEVEFIKKKFNEMEALVYASTIDLEALSKVMDLDSFARMYLIQEFSANLDSAATSFYITYDCSKGLFVASPVWDYDWALGQNNGSKKSKSGSDLYSKDATQWFARDKAMGKGDATGKYSLQSKLATDSNFKTVIKKVWNGKNNDGFYAKVQEYYKTDGYLDTWKNQISKSVNMNETRWGFIANNPLRSGAWGDASTNTTNFNSKTGFEGAVEFLKGTATDGWSKNRVDNLLNNGINTYGSYKQIATPTLTAYADDGKTALTGEVTVGDTYILKADTSEIYVDYVLYDGSTEVETNTTGVFTINNATAGTHSYTVKTVYNSDDEKTSTVAVPVTVSESTDVKTLTIYFKTATAPAYAPFVSFDGGDTTPMTTKALELGKDYSGALTFAWYSVEIPNVDTTKTHTLTFTSKRTKLNATWSGKLTKDSYFTADNLMSDTVAVDLTGKGDIEKNFFYSATNMVYDSTDAKNKTLGFTYYGGARVKMGSVVNELDGTVTAVSEPTVKSATYIQMINASLITVSSLQSELYDVNFDGKVDVKDATYIQYALAN